jgi:uncharacterized protein
MAAAEHEPSISGSIASGCGGASWLCWCCWKSRGSEVVAVEFDFERLRPALAEICLRYGIVELAVFGSFARGDVDPSSDVDILYVRAPGNDLGVDYFDLQDELERLFGRPVDLVPKEGLHWIVRDEVLAEARELYAAA